MTNQQAYNLAMDNMETMKKICTSAKDKKETERAFDTRHVLITQGHIDALPVVASCMGVSVDSIGADD